MRDLFLALVVATTLAAGGNTDHKVAVANLPPATQNITAVAAAPRPGEKLTETQRIVR